MKKKTENDLMEKVVSLAKRRGFVFPGSEIYGGLANSWDYGPLGVELKNNIKKFWWKRFVQERDDMVGIDSAIIMNPKVWEASGHLKEFSDPLVECKKCHERFREDTIEDGKCPNCGAKEFTTPKSFNLLFKTFIGAAEDTKSTAYLRGENAQGMFVNFKNVLDTSRRQLPFGIAQIGKAFRNEITPGNFVFRTREFEIMELEYFVRKDDWNAHFTHWQKEMVRWIKDVGIDAKKVHEVDIPDGERAHYSDKTIDFEFEYPFGQKELYGLAYRTDFDLKNHEKESGENLKYRDPETGEEFHPHVIEPSMGAERTFLAVLLSSYEETDDRVVLHLKPNLAPYKAGVFPLLANKPELVKFAREVYDGLRKGFPTGGQKPFGEAVAWDDRGNIGKRYYSQDEIGTPYCITIDFDSLEKQDVTVRERDTMKQERVMIEKLVDYLRDRV